MLHVLSFAAFAFIFINFYGAALALPVFEKNEQGTARIESAGNRLTIEQSSAFAAGQFSSFDIGAGEVVEVKQPNADATYFIRIDSNQASTIGGQLIANGNIVLENPAGLHFAQGSVTNVGGLMAMTGRASTQGLSSLSWDVLTGKGTILNEGDISVSGARAVFIARGFDNRGKVVGAGSIGILLGKRIAVNLKRVPLLLEVSEARSDIFVENSGTLQANGEGEGGFVAIAVADLQQLLGGIINLGGVVSAQQLVVYGDGNKITLELVSSAPTPPTATLPPAALTPSVPPAVPPSVPLTPSVTPSVTPPVTPSVTPAVTPPLTPAVTPTVTPPLILPPPPLVMESPTESPIRRIVSHRHLVAHHPKDILPQAHYVLKRNKRRGLHTSSCHGGGEYFQNLFCSE